MLRGTASCTISNDLKRVLCTSLAEAYLTFIYDAIKIFRLPAFIPLIVSLLRNCVPVKAVMDILSYKIDLICNMPSALLRTGLVVRRKLTHSGKMLAAPGKKKFLTSKEV